MILGLMGTMGTGKDTFADRLVAKHDFVKVAFADPLKRICKEVYDFSDEQLWGPSEKRNEPDPRYRRKCDRCGSEDGYVLTCGECDHGTKSFFLSPRMALQLLGTEWGRHCYENTWVDYALRAADLLLGTDTAAYSQREGVFDVSALTREDRWPSELRGVVIPDVRFPNEVKAIRAKGGKIIYLRRTWAQKITHGVLNHSSELEMAYVPAQWIDRSVDIPIGLEPYHQAIDEIMAEFADGT